MGWDSWEGVRESPNNLSAKASVKAPAAPGCGEGWQLHGQLRTMGIFLQVLSCVRGGIVVNYNCSLSRVSIRVPRKRVKVDVRGSSTGWRGTRTEPSVSSWVGA